MEGKLLIIDTTGFVCCGVGCGGGVGGGVAAWEGSESCVLEPIPKSFSDEQSQ